MRVNNISNSLNFTRAIEVKSNTNDADTDYVDKATKDVLRTFQGKKSPYHSNQRRLMITFFSRFIDKNADLEGNFDTVKINGRVYVFTGRDAKKAFEIKQEAEEEKNRINALYKNGVDESMSESDKSALQSKEIKKFLFQSIKKEKDEKLLDLVEDGTIGEDGKQKPCSFLMININKDGKADSIEYCSTLERAKSGKATRALFL